MMVISGYLSFQYGIIKQERNKTVREMSKQTMLLVPQATGLHVLLQGLVVTPLSPVHSY